MAPPKNHGERLDALEETVQTLGNRLEAVEESLQSMKVSVQMICNQDAVNSKKMENLDRGIQLVVMKLESMGLQGAPNMGAPGVSMVTSQASGSELARKTPVHREIPNPIGIGAEGSRATRVNQNGPYVTDWRLRRVELPMFQGEDPDGCRINRISSFEIEKKDTIREPPLRHGRRERTKKKQAMASTNTKKGKKNRKTSSLEVEATLMGLEARPTT